MYLDNGLFARLCFGDGAGFGSGGTTAACGRPGQNGRYFCEYGRAEQFRIISEQLAAENRGRRIFRRRLQRSNAGLGEYYDNRVYLPAVRALLFAFRSLRARLPAAI